MMHTGQTSGTALGGQQWWRVSLNPVERRRLTILASIVLIYAAFAQTMAALAGESGIVLTYQLADYALLLICASLFLIAVGYFCGLLFEEKEPRPLKRAWSDLTANVLRRDRFISYSIPLLLLPLFIPAFLTLKSLIPAFHPFAFDAAFYEMDRVLHGGIDPWRVTHAVFGMGSATVFLAVLYNAWFMLIWGVALYAILRVDRPVERFRYLCSLLLCWIVIGTVLAYLLSSAGPCYYGHFVSGPDPYQPLMERLKQINQQLVSSGSSLRIWSLQAQQLLWEFHSTPAVSKFGGISAMPSMHVSLSVLMAIGMRQFNRRLSAVLWVYAALIFVGSVHLGWHYAVDGYVAIAATLAIWRSVGWAVRSLGLELGREEEAPGTVPARLRRYRPDLIRASR